MSIHSLFPNRSTLSLKNSLLYEPDKITKNADYQSIDYWSVSKIYSTARFLPNKALP